MVLEALGRKNVAGPLLLLNLVLYIFMLGFASWALDSFIDGHQYHPVLGAPCECRWGNDATLHFVQFSALAATVGVAAKLATAYHARAWRAQGLAAAASLGTVAWAVTALALGLACKEMRVGAGGGVERGWRLRALEGLTVVLALTQLLYVLLLHAAVGGDRCGPGCPDGDEQPRGPCGLM